MSESLEHPTLTVSRSMQKSELSGQHSHATEVGVNVHIFRRGPTYIARGRFDRKAFGVGLGTEESKAIRELRRLLVRIENGTFMRPSEARHRPLPNRVVPQMTLRELCDAFLAETRSIRGADTARTYLERLGPVLNFFERRDSLRRWPRAADLDREAIVQLRSYFMTLPVTRNAKAGAAPKVISTRHARNCMETLRTALRWGSRAEVRRLPPEFVQPITPELLVPMAIKDPLRGCLVPLADRIRVVQQMDPWQLSHLSILLLLPIRHEDVAGALISNLNEGLSTLTLGHRFQGNDFNKGRTNLQMPLPAQLQPLLRHCVAGRADGPLFRSRRARTGLRSIKVAVTARGDTERLINDRLLDSPPGAIYTEPDRKKVIRGVVKDLGGVSRDVISKELSALLRGAGLQVRPYELKASITQEMKQAGVNPMELQYLTGHSLTGILHTYTGLQPVSEMNKYFGFAEPLLSAIAERASELKVSVN